MSDELDYSEPLHALEAYIMGYSVKSHQSELEANGMYNVRQKAHWKGGFDGEAFVKHEARQATKRSDHGYKFDRRKAPDSELNALKKEKKLELSNAEYRKWWKAYQLTM